MPSEINKFYEDCCKKKWSVYQILSKHRVQDHLSSCEIILYMAAVKTKLNIRDIP